MKMGLSWKKNGKWKYGSHFLQGIYRIKTKVKVKQDVVNLKTSHPCCKGR